jgi:hypothetical protein
VQVSNLAYFQHACIFGHSSTKICCRNTNQMCTETRDNKTENL